MAEQTSREARAEDREARAVTDESVRMLAEKVESLSRRQRVLWAAIGVGVALILTASVGAVRLNQAACESGNQTRASVRRYNDVLLATAAANPRPGQTPDEAAAQAEIVAEFRAQVAADFAPESCGVW